MYNGRRGRKWRAIRRTLNGRRQSLALEALWHSHSVEEGLNQLPEGFVRYRRDVRVALRLQGIDGAGQFLMRDECLRAEWVRTRREARIMIVAWRQHYKAVRPHSSLDHLTPLAISPQHQTPSEPSKRAVLQD